MTFIESWIGFSPDGGNGTWEATLVIAAAVMLATIIRLRYASHVAFVEKLPRRLWQKARPTS
jgi:hypothetical protein